MQKVESLPCNHWWSRVTRPNGRNTAENRKEWYRTQRKKRRQKKKKGKKAKKENMVIIVWANPSLSPNNRFAHEYLAWQDAPRAQHNLWFDEEVYNVRISLPECHSISCFNFKDCVSMLQSRAKFTRLLWYYFNII